MARNFSTNITINGAMQTVIIVPVLRRNGMHYEVNIPGYQRFWMRWGAMDRYEVVKPPDVVIPDDVALAVSDAVEREER